jgi:sulfite reductase (NADPH) flavoprotein alpha-component
MESLNYVSRFPEQMSHYVYEDGQRCRIDNVMDETKNAEILWTLLRAAEEDGLGAHFYICGRTRFAVTVLDGLRRIICRKTVGTEQERTEKANHMLYDMVANGRLQQDIFPSYSGVTTQIENKYDASEIVLHNSPERGYWLVISGRVYDVTQFMNQHAGGQKIMIGSAGIDATRVFQSVMHHVNTEVEAMLGMYEIGVVRRLDFRQEWGTALGPDGLIFVPVEEAFRTWVRYLYVIVEMQNTLNNDFSILDRSTTYQEPPEQLTPLKLQIVTEAHKRFVTTYLDGIIGEDAQVLWSVTSGLCAPDEHILWMQQEMERIDAKPEARFASQCVEVLWTMIHGLKAATGRDYERRLEQLAALAAMVEEEDKHLFQEIKDITREGVMVFEQYEADVIRLGANTLMTSIKRIPRAVEAYHKRVAARMVAFDEKLAARLKEDTSTAEFEITPEFPGHGMRDHQSVLEKPPAVLEE